MPEAAIQKELVIQTYYEEIEVRFGGYNTFFGEIFSFGQLSNVEEMWSAAQRFIEDLMAERIIVTVRVNRWAMCHAPDAPPQMPSLPEYVPPTYTRSWRGTYNRVYQSDKNRYID